MHLGPVEDLINSEGGSPKQIAVYASHDAPYTQTTTHIIELSSIMTLAFTTYDFSPSNKCR